MLGDWRAMQRMEHALTVAEPPQDLVQRLRSALAAELPPELAEVLLPVLTLGSEPGGLTLATPNALWAGVVRQHALPAIERWASRAAPGLSLRLIDLDATPAEAPASEDRARTFSGFLEDPGNQIALAACRRVVEQPGLEHNPLYLHGPGGSGKSHLLAAVAGEYRMMLGDASAAMLLSGPELVAKHAQDLARRATDGLRAALDQAAVILVDDMDALAGRDLAQEELFHVVNAALDRGAQLVFAGRHAPRKLAGFTDRLASRLAWGLTVGLDAPHLETRVALVRRVAGDAVARADVGDLTALVDAQAPDMHQAVILGERLRRGGIDLTATRPRGASFDRIVQVVAEVSDLRPGDIAGKRRHAEVVLARGLALLLGRRLTDHSLEALGGMVGGRDHSTVMHALRTTEARVAAEPALQRTVAELTRRVLAPEGR
jgi:chromosomal replication initiator protein